MKRIVFLLMSVLTLTLQAKDDDEEFYHPSFIMPNGNQTVYFIDSVYIDNYVVVQSGINFQCFMITDSTYRIKRKPRKYWEEPNAIIVNDDITQLFNYYEPYPDDSKKNSQAFLKIWPYRWDAFPISTTYRGTMDHYCEYPNGKPTLFGMFMITGNAYNKISCYQCIDCNFPRPIDFKNPFAYYVVVYPIR